MQTVRQPVQPIIGRDPGYPEIFPRAYLADGQVNPEAISYYRAMNWLTQEQLGQLLGVSARSVSAWERGEYAPGFESTARIHQFIQATNKVLVENHGFIPPDKALARWFDSDDVDLVALFMEARAGT